jgi:hypothetical protein
MKYSTQLDFKLRSAAVALGVLSISCLTPTRGQESKNMDKPATLEQQASADAVPEGLTAYDWTSIRVAYEAHRHAAVRVGDGYRARNPEQQWRTEFDGYGFITRPEAGDWQWGLELKSYGFPGQKCVIDHGAEVTAEGTRVTYRRDTGLREWFVNDQRGLEHGFTVEQRPPGATDAEARLEFDLAVRGSLRPAISGDRKTLRFEDARGHRNSRHSGLKGLGCRRPVCGSIRGG